MWSPFSPLSRRLVALCVLCVAMVPGPAEGEEYQIVMEKNVGRRLTNEEITLTLDTHNDYRRQQNAKDMNFMYYDRRLEAQVLDWVDQCQFFHGFDDPATYGILEWSSQGQNLWASNAPYNTDGSFGLKGAIDAWYNEISWYDYGTRTCQSGKMCGHYTQVVWANSQYVGCAYKHCDTVTYKDGSTANDVQIYGCNYGPAGNYVGQDPFIAGTVDDACTECKSGSQECDNGLCRMCSVDGGTCGCQAQCMNCGVAPTNGSDCHCQCADGWHGTSCQQPCEDTHQNCGAGWYKAQCTNPDSIWDVVRAKCLVLCEKCENTNPVAEGSCAVATTDIAVQGPPESGYGNSVVGGSSESTAAAGSDADTTAAGDNPTTTTSTTTTTTTASTTTTTTATTTTPTTTTTTTTPRTTTTTTRAPTTTTTPPPTPPPTTTKPPTTWPTRASTTTTTTSPPPSTTPGALPADPCAQTTCDNGGSPDLAPSGTCACRCLPEYHGDRCEKIKQETLIGVQLRINGDLADWPAIFNYLEPLVVDAVNDHCNLETNFPSCCPDAGHKAVTEHAAILSVGSLYTGTSFPQPDGTHPDWFISMLYALVSPDNALCRLGSNYAPAATRRRRGLSLARAKRNTDLQNSIPQDVLLAAVNKANLTAGLKTCCDVILVSAERAEVEISVFPAQDETGIPNWAVGVTAVVALALLAAGAGMALWFLLIKNKSTRVNDTPRKQPVISVQSLPETTSSQVGLTKNDMWEGRN